MRALSFFVTALCCLGCAAVLAQSSVRRALPGGGWSIKKMGRSAIFDQHGRQLSDYIFPDYFRLLSDKRVAVFRPFRNGFVSCEENQNNMWLYDLKGRPLAGRLGNVQELRSDLISVHTNDQEGLLYKNGRFVPLKDEVCAWCGENPTVFVTYKRRDCLLEEDWTATPSLYGWVNVETGYHMPARFDKVMIQGHKIYAQRTDTTFVYDDNGKFLRMAPFPAWFSIDPTLGIYAQQQKFGLVDSALTIVLSPRYEALKPIGIKVFLFSRNQRYGLLDGKCNEVVPPICDTIVRLSEKRGLYLLSLEGKKRVTDAHGVPLLGGTDYERIEQVSDDLFFVSQNGHQKLVDLAGKSQLDTYELLACTERHLLLVRQAGKQGLLTPDGKMLLPLEFDSIVPQYYHKLILYKGAYMGMANDRGEIFLPPVFESLTNPSGHQIIGVQKGRYGLWDTLGNSVLSPDYQNIKIIAGRYLNGVMYRYYSVWQNGKYGIVDQLGQWQVPIEYDQVRAAAWPLALTTVLGRDTIDWATGQGILKPVPKGLGNLKVAYWGSEFDENGPYGFTFKGKDGKLGLLDSDTWRVLWPPRYDQLEVVLRPDFFAICRRGNLIEFIKNPEGDVYRTFEADSFGYYEGRFMRFWRGKTTHQLDLFHFGDVYPEQASFDTALLALPELMDLLGFRLSRFKVGSHRWLRIRHQKEGAYNPTTKAYLPVEHYRIETMDSARLLLAFTWEGCKIYHESGKLLSLSDDVYHISYSFGVGDYGFIAKKNEKYTVYNKYSDTLEQLHPAWFDDIELEESCFVTSINSTSRYFKKGLLSPKGEQWLPPDYAAIRPSEGGWMVWKDRQKKGFLRHDGKLILPCVYDSIEPDFPYLLVGQAGQFGLVDYHGRVVLPIKYDKIICVEDGQGVYKIQKKGKEKRKTFPAYLKRE